MKNFFKKIYYTELLFSIIFAFAIFFMSKIVFLGYVYDENYMDLVFFNEFIIVLLFVPIIYFCIRSLEKYYKNIIDYIILKEEFKPKIKFCIVAFIFLLIVYLLYFLSFYPGGVYIDTWTSLLMLEGQEPFTNHHPVLYTLALNIVKAFSPDLLTGFGVFTFIQILIMVGSIVYFLYWLLNKKVNSNIVTFITIFFAIFKLYPLYSISIWKDTPFSISLFLFSLTVIDLVLDFNKKKLQTKNIIKFTIMSLLVMSLRNNGTYIVIATFLLLIITYIKDIFKNKNIQNIKHFLISSACAILIILIIQKLYPVFGIKQTEFVENIAIPIQQVARVVATDGNITENQMELIEKVFSEKNIKKHYRALIVDGLKWDSEFNEEYLENHKFEYLKLWFELLIQNPDEYLRAYLLHTSGFWTFNVRGEEAYASPQIWETLNDKIENKDYILEYTNSSIKNSLLPTDYYSGGFFFWFMIISMVITYRMSSKRYLIGYLPCLLLWITIMIATPMGSSLRYVFGLVLILPLDFIYPIIAKNEYESDIELNEKNNSK